MKPIATATNGNDNQQSHPNPALIEAEIALMTDDDLRRMCRESLVMIIHGNKGKLVSLGAIKELVDRLDGKPAQSLSMKVEMNPLSKLSSDKLLQLENDLARVLGQDQVVIAPVPGKLDD